LCYHSGCITVEPLLVSFVALNQLPSSFLFIGGKMESSLAFLISNTCTTHSINRSNLPSNSMSTNIFVTSILMPELSDCHLQVAWIRVGSLVLCHQVQPIISSSVILPSMSICMLTSCKLTKFLCTLLG